MSEQNPIGPSEHPAKSNDVFQSRERFFDLKFSHYIEIILTAALVSIAYFQYTVYSRQADIMDKQARIAEIQNKISMEAQRAFVFVKELPWSPTKEDDGTAKWNILISWENNGSTQPKNLIMDSYCVSFSQQDDPTKFRPKDWPVFRRVMGPKQETIAGVCTPSLADLQATQQHQKWFYIVTTAIYDDVFGGQHITEYCQLIDFIVGDLSNVNTAPLRSTSACPVHNCSDDECQDKNEVRKILLEAPRATKPMAARSIP